MKGLNKKDIEIIKILKEDGRISDAEIGRRLGLSKTTIRWRRMKLIEEKKIMIIPIIVYDNTGHSYARVGVKLKKDASPSKIQAFEEELVQNENVYALFETIGIYDLIICFSTQRSEGLYKAINRTLRGKQEIMDYDITLFMKTLKAWGVPVSKYST